MNNPFVRSVRLRAVPTHREARQILGRLGADLEARGAELEPRGGDTLRFRLPAPWRAPRASWLHVATGGEAHVTAGGGGPWRVKYDLRFARIRVVCLVLTALVLAVGLGWPRLELIYAIAAVWMFGYLGLGAAATATLARLVRAASSEIAERRRTPRSSGAQTAETPTSIATLEGEDRTTGGASDAADGAGNGGHAARGGAQRAGGTGDHVREEREASERPPAGPPPV